MAIAKGTNSTDGVVIKRYIGVAPVFVLGVNPNKAGLTKLYGRDFENEPVYVNKVKSKDGSKDIDNARVDFIIKTDASKCNGIEFITKATFFIKNEFNVSNDGNKVKVIDKYGATAWVTKEQLSKHEIPVYSNGPANLDTDYRPAYSGEEELTTFIKNYLNIPNVKKYVNGAWVPNEKVSPADCECRLESVAKYFTGDFSELSAIVTMQPENKVKVMIGVRTDENNKQFQTVYTNYTLKNSVSDYSKLDADLKERKKNGAMPNSEFSATPIKEYVNTPSDLGAAPSSADPWAF